jgi:hypothetical protein
MITTILPLIHFISIILIPMFIFFIIVFLAIKIRTVNPHRLVNKFF